MANPKINAVIIDDEQDSIDTLAWKLDNYCPEVHILEKFTNPLEGLEYLKNHELDLLFLDIEMPLLNGFDILQELEGFKFDVIFVTAYDEFGIQAIKFSALDYILKPIQIQELQEAIQKLLTKMSKGLNSNEQFEMLFKNLKLQQEGKNCLIPLSTKESIEFVEPDEIVSFESDSNYTIVHFFDGRKKMMARTLKEFDLMLAHISFFRPHHSHLVNIKHIKEYVRSDGGYIVMRNAKKIPISKSRKESFLNLMQGLLDK